MIEGREKKKKRESQVRCVCVCVYKNDDFQVMMMVIVTVACLFTQLHELNEHFIEHRIANLLLLNFPFIQLWDYKTWVYEISIFIYLFMCIYTCLYLDPFLHCIVLIFIFYFFFITLRIKYSIIILFWQCVFIHF